MIFVTLSFHVIAEELQLEGTPGAIQTNLLLKAGLTSKVDQTIQEFPHLICQNFLG